MRKPNRSYLEASGTPNYLVINGTSGDDFLIGTSDPDTINGFEGNDILIGEGGIDNLRGGPGDDIYRAETYDEDIRELEGEGYDAVYTVGDYALFQGQEIELLSAIDPASTVGLFLRGNQLSQTIIGTAGGDEIVGGTAATTLIGRGGDDIYEIGNAATSSSRRLAAAMIPHSSNTMSTTTR